MDSRIAIIPGDHLTEGVAELVTVVHGEDRLVDLSASDDARRTTIRPGRHWGRKMGEVMVLHELRKVW